MSQQHCPQCHAPIEPGRYTCRRCGASAVPEYSRGLKLKLPLLPKVKLKLPPLPHIPRKLVITGVTIIAVVFVLVKFIIPSFHRAVALTKPAILIAPAEVMVESAQEYDADCITQIPMKDRSVVVAVLVLKNASKKPLTVAVSDYQTPQTQTIRTQPQHVFDAPQGLAGLFSKRVEVPKEQEKKNEKAPDDVVHDFLLIFKGEEYSPLAQTGWSGDAYAIRKFKDTVDYLALGCTEEDTRIQSGSRPLGKWREITATSTEEIIFGAFPEPLVRLQPDEIATTTLVFYRPPEMKDGDTLTINAKVGERSERMAKGKAEIVDTTKVEEIEKKLWPLNYEIDKINDELKKFVDEAEKKILDIEKQTRESVRYFEGFFFFSRWYTDSYNLADVQSKIAGWERAKKSGSLSKEQEETLRNFRDAEKKLNQRIEDAKKGVYKELDGKSAKLKTDKDALQKEQRKILGLE